jgi:hypothetical protein
MSLFKKYLAHKIGDQEIFNHVYNQMIIQEKPAVTGMDCVLYNPINGRKCSLGHILSDKDLDIINKTHGGYNLGVNGICMTLGLEMGFIWNSSWNHEHGFLNDIRSAHDAAMIYTNFIHSFKGKMKEIAEKYNLTIPGE